MSLLTDLREQRDREERVEVESALRQFGGNVSRAAKYLGMSRTSLYRRLVAYGMADYKVGPVRKRA